MIPVTLITSRSDRQLEDLEKRLQNLGVPDNFLPIESKAYFEHDMMAMLIDDDQN
jgi:hypothetical protein